MEHREVNASYDRRAALAAMVREAQTWWKDWDDDLEVVEQVLMAVFCRGHAEHDPRRAGREREPDVVRSVNPAGDLKRHADPGRDLLFQSVGGRIGAEDRQR